MHSRLLTSPARAALMAVAFASTGAVAQTADVAAAPPVVATIPEAAPPPPVRTMTETVAPEALAQVRAEQAAKAKPVAKPVARAAAAPVRRAAVVAPTTPNVAPVPTQAAMPAAAEPDTILPAPEAPLPVADSTPLPETEAAAVSDNGSDDNLMLYGGIAAALGLAGIGAAFAARRRKIRFSEDDRGAAQPNANRAAAPQPRPMAATAAPVLAEPGRTRVIEPAAVPAAPVAARIATASVVAATRNDPIFDKRAPVAEGVTDPLFTRKTEPLPPVTDPLFSHKVEVPPVTDPMFADRAEYAGPGSNGSRAAAINRMRVAENAPAESTATVKAVDFV